MGRSSERPFSFLDQSETIGDFLCVARGEKLLERMRGNPRDWRIEDVETACSAFGIACTPPRKGSHYKVKHESQAEMLTIPAHRPIKPVYIDALVRFVDAVKDAAP